MKRSLLMVLLLASLLLCACSKSDRDSDEVSGKNRGADIVSDAEDEKSEDDNSNGTFLETETEKLVRETPFVFLDDVIDDVTEDMDQASKKYNGKTFKLRVCGYNREEDHFNFILSKDEISFNTLVYMDKEELEEIPENGYITVLGEVNVVSETEIEVNNAFWCDEYERVRFLTDSEEKDVIDNYGGTGGDDSYNWDEGSMIILRERRPTFELISEEEFLETVIGEWKGKEYDEMELVVNFKNNFEADIIQIICINFFMTVKI